MASKKVNLNFNTKQMKVAFFDVSDEDFFQPIDDIMMSNLLKAAAYALHRSNHRGESVHAYLVVSPVLHFGDKETGLLVAHFKNQGAKILSTDDLTFVVQSMKGHFVTFKVVGGHRYGTLPAGKDDDSSSSGDSSSYEEMNNKGLTQECQGYK